MSLWGSEHAAWLATLVPGAEVAVTKQYHEAEVGVVSRVSESSVWVKFSHWHDPNAETRFRRDDGLAVGSHTYSRRRLVPHSTEIKDEAERKRLVRRLQAINFNVMSLIHLRALNGSLSEGLANTLDKGGFKS
jgi:hypothetical protein